jgi:Tol biopolymer transport system component
LWSPNGKTLLYFILDKTNPSKGTLFEYTIDENKTNKLLQNVIIELLASSPDGEKILLRMLTEKQWNTFILHLDSEKMDQIPISGSAYNFAWSPTGDMIMYEISDKTPQATSKLIVFNLSNQQSTTLQVDKGILGIMSDDPNFPERSVWSYSPTWSPDAKYLAFFTTPEPDALDKRRLVLNIQSIDTGKRLEYELPKLITSNVNTPFWIYP